MNVSKSVAHSNIIEFTTFILNALKDRGAPFRPGTLRRPLDSQMDRKKIKLLQGNFYINIF